jgi:hypothetical protein
MKKFLKSKKGLALLATMVVAVATAVGAYAYWTQGGSGTGSATTGTTTAITVVQDSLTASNLYPGGPSEALSGHFINPNLSPVNVGSVTATVDAFSARANLAKPPCTEADFEIGGTSGPRTALADDTTTWSGLTIKLNDNGLNQDNCKSVTPALTYTATAGA